VIRSGCLKANYASDCAECLPRKGTLSFEWHVLSFGLNILSFGWSRLDSYLPHSLFTIYSG
jgi:hypothetical protein